MQEKIKKSALGGIRVIDMTRVLAGPYCTLLLGDMGAEIIKIEVPGHGDDSRKYPPFIGTESAYFMNLNRNKKSLTLNLKAPEGKTVLIDLVKRSDVLIENFRPGTLDDLGVGYATLKAVNPSLVYSSISGFGHSGPCKDLPGYDIIGQAMGGIMSVTGCMRPSVSLPLRQRKDHQGERPGEPRKSRHRPGRRGHHPAPGAGCRGIEVQRREENLLVQGG